MKTSKTVVLYCLLVSCSLALFGCRKKADETKPLTEVQAEAEKMDAEKLRSMALSYKDAIISKKAELERLTSELKAIPLKEMLEDNAKKLQTEINTLLNSVSALKERFHVYYTELKEKAGDLSDLDF
jgi:hypothetical protein